LEFGIDIRIKTEDIYESEFEIVCKKKISQSVTLEGIFRTLNKYMDSVFDFTAAEGAVTVNVGVKPTGPLAKQITIRSQPVQNFDYSFICMEMPRA